jgi:hypothetical protein
LASFFCLYCFLHISRSTNPSGQAQADPYYNCLRAIFQQRRNWRKMTVTTGILSRGT